MNRRRTLWTGAVTVAALGVALTANALWSAGRTTVEPTMQVGAVTFAAQVGDDTASRQVSVDGGAVQVRLPGSEIVRVLDQTGPDSDPVIWRFRATGAALGITGLVYDVAVTEQVDQDGQIEDLSDGVAQAGTVLAGTSLKVYPAAAGGDCSAVPEMPEGQEDRNVVVYGGDQVELQAAGENPTGADIVREWCVALNWEDDPDGVYANEVQAVGTGQDGTQSQSLAEWAAVVAFPPSLDPLGSYLNRVLAEGTAEDSTTSRAEDDWDAVLYPDPSAEPDVVITLDPAVTNLNPAVETGDHAVTTAA